MSLIAVSPRGGLCCAAGLLLATLLAGCASPPKDPAERAVFEQTNDPLEPLNRNILNVNLFVDRILLKPVTKVYIAIVPEEGRDAAKRLLDNMKEPVLVINNVLQGRPKSAGISVGRFVVNSTLGVGGLFDIAKKWGLDRQNADFGQTMYVWGLPEGPYLIVPILGPSSPRDLLGMGTDAYIDPFSYLATRLDLDEIEISRFVLDGIDQRARAMDVLDDLQKNSLDFYAQLRSLVQQHRAAELRRGAAPQPDPNFYQDPNKTPAGPATSSAAPQQANPAPLPAKAESRLSPAAPSPRP